MIHDHDSHVGTSRDDGGGGNRRSRRSRKHHRRVRRPCHHPGVRCLWRTAPLTERPTAVTTTPRSSFAGYGSGLVSATPETKWARKRPTEKETRKGTPEMKTKMTETDMESLRREAR